jgi:thiosulfate/3-mercaptopyruvate sulfurtransferase
MDLFQPLIKVFLSLVGLSLVPVNRTGFSDALLKNPRKGEKKMEKRILFALAAFILMASLFLAGHAYAKHVPPWTRTIDPIVSTDWLSAHGAEVVILDIRSPADYTAGHIPGSINEPFVTAFDPCKGPSSNWIVGSDDCLWLQVPDVNNLLITIGNLGILRDSRVVVVTAPNPGEPPFYGFANATRVALTLIYAGVKNVAILDGGYPKWAVELRPISTVPTNATPVTYQPKVNKEMFVSVEYVRKHIGKAVIVDARDAEVYFGVTIEDFAPKEGHIPHARSLPTPWMWKLNPDGTYTYKDTKTLGAMASGVVGRYKGIEAIVYCGVGGYASSWWFVLTQVLGYENVKIYDGSAQEWVKYYDMVPYQWD